MNIYRKSLNSISKINNQKTTMDFDKILNEKSVMEYSIDTNQPKMFSEEMIKGRFYGPPTPLQTDYTFEMLNNANVYMLRFYTSALNFYNRLVCILESIIHETSSTHHSSDFIRYSQKHILLKGKASNTITILDELMASKQRVGHSLEALYMDCICRLTGKTDMQETCWKWLVRNSKLINAIMKRVTVVETIESIRNEGTGKMVVIADFTKIIEAVIKATYNQYMVKLSDVGRNMMEIVCMLEIENHYMKYMVMARRLDAGKNQANTQKKRALYLSTEVIQKTKMHGQNKRAVTFHQLAQRGAKIGNPMVAMAQSFKKFSNLSNNRKEGSLSVNRDRSLPSVSGLSTDKSYRKTPNEKSKSQDKEYLTQYQTFLNMRKDLGQQFSQLSKYKNRLLGKLSLIKHLKMKCLTCKSLDQLSHLDT